MINAARGFGQIIHGIKDAESPKIYEENLDFGNISSHIYIYPVWSYANQLNINNSKGSELLFVKFIFTNSENE